MDGNAKRVNNQIGAYAMAMKDISSRAAVEHAIDEYFRIGRESFLTRYGFLRSKDYFIVWEDALVDSKPILGVAHRYQFPEEGALGPSDFSGGVDHAAGRLESLGFEIRNQRETAWGDSEFRHVVAAYISLLELYGAGEVVSKAETLRRVRSELPGRRNAEIESALRQISAVLRNLGLPSLKQFSPLEPYPDELGDFVLGAALSAGIDDPSADEIPTADEAELDRRVARLLQRPALPTPTGHPPDRTRRLKDGKETAGSQDQSVGA